MEKKVITDSAVISSIREAMPVATAEDKGLMDMGKEMKYIGLRPTEIFQSTGRGGTATLLLSYTTQNGGDAGVFVLKMQWPQSWAKPSVKLEVVAKGNNGANAGLVWKSDESNKLQIFSKATEYTHAIHVLQLLNTFSGGLCSRVVADAELEDATEVTLEE